MPDTTPGAEPASFWIPRTHPRAPATPKGDSPVKKYWAVVAAGMFALAGVLFFAAGPGQAPRPPAGPAEEEPVYFCGRIESISDNTPTRPWPVKTITWNLDTSAYRGSISPLQLREAFRVAWAAWTAYLDLDAKMIDDPAKALVVSKFGAIDGAGKVLAWSELADGTTTPKEQLFDSAESWEISATPTQIDLVRVACHELGHVLGLTHDDPGTGALMCPTYDKKVRFPTSRDVKRLLAMGYKAKPIAPGDPAQPVIPPLNLQVDGAQVLDALEKAGFKVERK